MGNFKLTMHAASDGDALRLSWGPAGKLRHALVDLGRTGNYRALKPLLGEIGAFELFVISHIDADHIEGAVPFLKEVTPPFVPKDVWFNTYADLVKANERLAPEEHTILGAVQAEKVTEALMARGGPWNRQFKSRIVSIDNPEISSPNGLKPIRFEGGLMLTLLSPDDRKLARLIPTWARELEREGLRPTDPDEVEEARAGRVHLGRRTPDVEQLAAEPFDEDDTAPNGTSIAFIAEYGGKRILMGADAHPGIVASSLVRLGATAQKPYRLDCLKVAHHGSKANTSPAFLRLIDCTRFAFSTDGSRHNHPNAQAIARILKADRKRKKTLFFNSRHETTEIWDKPALKEEWNYDCVFPDGNGKEIELEI